MAFREIPPIQYNKDVERLVKYYKRSYLLIVQELIRQIETDGSLIYRNQEASLARQIGLILKQNDAVIQREVADLLERAHVKGQAQALLSLGEASTLAEATKGVSFSLLAQRSVEALVTDTFEDVLALTNRTDIRIKKTIREASGEIMRINAIQQIGYDTNKKQLMEKLLKQGFSKKVQENFKGVTDSAGRKWKLDSYVSMLVQTKIQQSYIEGVRTEATERGVDLAMISSHSAKDACSNYEGTVISMNGQTPGYRTLSDLRGTNLIFHPRCRHTITPLRSFDLLPESLQKKHEEQTSKLKK